jgi:hypothetical protein
MDTADRADLRVPVAALDRLSIPDLAVTDGSGHIEMVDMPCAGGWRFAAKPVIRLPLDPLTAETARQWIAWRRCEDRVFSPALLGLAMVLAVMIIWDPANGLDRYVGLAAILGKLGLAMWMIRREAKLKRPQFPVLVNRGRKIRLAAVPIDVCREWVSRNPDVEGIDPRARYHFP